MISLRTLCILVVFLSLSACDDKTSRTAAQPQNTTQQQSPAPSNAQTTQSISALKARIAMNPNDFEALSTLGDVYFESSQFVDAFQTYDKAIAVNPNCADCYNDRGLSLFYLGDATSALESFDKAVAISPGYTHAWLSKGYVLVSEGRYKEAIAPLNKVKEIDTTGVLALQADKFLAVIEQNSTP